MQDQGVMGRHRNEGALKRSKTRKVKYPITNVDDFLRAPIVATLIRREDHMIQDRASLLSIDPQEDPGLRYTGFHVEMVTMQRDTSILIGRAGKDRAGKPPGELLQGREPSFGLAEHLQGHGGLEAFFEQTL